MKSMFPASAGVLPAWAAALAMVTSIPAWAGEPAPLMGRYLPLYPGTYFTAGFLRDERDSSFDRNGNEVASAVPTAAGSTGFPESRYEATFAWYFPLFETRDYAFISDRLFTTRLGFGYANEDSEGGLVQFIATNPDGRPRTRTGANGWRDVTLEFGSFLYGSDNWRTRANTPVSVLLLLGFTAPVGTYDRQAPVTPGSNHFTWHANLGAHWQPWRGGFLDAGAGWRGHETDDEPQFGGLAPKRQGDDLLLDASFAQKLWGGLYLTAFFTHRETQANTYRDIAYAPNAPDPPPAAPPAVSSETFPTPGTYRDGGTFLRTAGVNLQYFLSQRWLLGLHWTHPLAGESGQFLLPFTDRTCTAGGSPGAVTCTDSAGETRLQDGQGAARSFASDSLMLTLIYSFPSKDLFPCPGCQE